MSSNLSQICVLNKGSSVSHGFSSLNKSRWSQGDSHVNQCLLSSDCVTMAQTLAAIKKRLLVQKNGRCRFPVIVQCVYALCKGIFTSVIVLRSHGQRGATLSVSDTGGGVLWLLLSWHASLTLTTKNKRTDMSHKLDLDGTCFPKHAVWDVCYRPSHQCLAVSSWTWTWTCQLPWTWTPIQSEDTVADSPNFEGLLEGSDLCKVVVRMRFRLGL